MDAYLHSPRGPAPTVVARVRSWRSFEAPQARRHEDFMTVAAIGPGEIVAEIAYSFHRTAFGPMIVAASPRGLIRATFLEEGEDRLAPLRCAFPQARLIEIDAGAHAPSLAALGAGATADLAPVRLHVQGTPFQIKVWRALLQIPHGCLTSYGELASGVGQPAASRAVGTAIGANPVAFLVPCHRVVRAGGEIGGYRWGQERKRALIAWEQTGRAA